MDGSVRVAAATQIPVVVLAGARLVVGDHVGAGRGRRGAATGGGVRSPARSPSATAAPAPRAAAAAARSGPGAAGSAGTRCRRPGRRSPSRAAPSPPGRPVRGRCAPAAPQAGEGRRKGMRGRPAQSTGTGVQRPAGRRRRSAAGSNISASSSMPSMTRGPGRLKYAEPSSANTAPPRAAGRSRQPGPACRRPPTRGPSRPGGNRTASGRASPGRRRRRRPRSSRWALSPSVPSRSQPPARRICSGTQWPTANGGSSHSRPTTRGA